MINKNEASVHSCLYTTSDILIQRAVALAVYFHSPCFLKIPSPSREHAEKSRNFFLILS